MGEGYFLACQAFGPGADLAIGDASDLPPIPTTVERIDRPAPNVVDLRLRPREPFEYRAGQFVHVIRPDGLTRSYSLASVPGADDALELHVKRMPGGAMSGYLCETLRRGDTLTLRGPFGQCIYATGRSTQPLLLAGTGTGLAPLLGVARDALHAGHEGTIELHHGALDRAGLYAHDRLVALAERYPRFRYAPTVLSGGDGGLVTEGDLKERFLARVRATPGARVFLCGPPELTNPLKKAIFLAGTPLRDILSDAFVTAAAPASAPEAPRANAG